MDRPLKSVKFREPNSDCGPFFVDLALWVLMICRVILLTYFEATVEQSATLYPAI